MDLIPKEAFLSILGHLSERERIRMLRTCKRMREWLQKRLQIARAAFDAFKAHCMTIGWTEYDELQVRHYRVMHLRRGTERLLISVGLEETGLISIEQRDKFTRAPPMIDVRFFAPWFHDLTSRKGRKVRTSEPDHIVKMLLDASPPLG
jgi:hypothetical protein